MEELNGIKGVPVLYSLLPRAQQCRGASEPAYESHSMEPVPQSLQVTTLSVCAVAPEAGESQGQRSLVGFHLWGRTESDTTEVT